MSFNNNLIFKTKYKDTILGIIIVELPYYCHLTDNSYCFLHYF